MGAGFIELISSIVDITGNPIADTIIFAIIGSISASIAFGLVEILFDFTGKYNSKDMSDLHWGVRVFLFALITFILVKIAQFFRWLFTPPQVYFLVAGIVLMILTIVTIVVIKSKKHTINTKISSEQQLHIPLIEIEKPIEIETRTEDSNPNICPFCGGQLVKRKGPYGRFLGCINFPKCKYTRK